MQSRKKEPFTNDLQRNEDTKDALRHVFNARPSKTKIKHDERGPRGPTAPKNTTTPIPVTE
jgi:hypothetical protein